MVTYISLQVLIHALVRAMGSKSDLPHLNMPIMDTLEDLESSFNAQVRHKLTASGDMSVSQDDDSEEFMSQVSLKLDSLHKDEKFDLAQTSPLQELGSLPSCNANTAVDQSDATNIPLGNLFGDGDNEDIVDDVTDDLSDLTAQFSCDGQLLDKDFEVSETSCTVSELVVHPPKLDELLESTTPLGTIYSNDTTIPPVEHDPKKGKTACGAEQYDSVLVKQQCMVLILFNFLATTMDSKY